MDAIDGTIRGVCPHDCPDTCAWEVTVRDGVATQLVGDDSHPFTRGGLCAKVAAACPEQVRALVMIEPHGLPLFPAPPEGYPPQLTVIADYVSRSAVWTRLMIEVREYSALLRRHGITADLLDLPAEGIYGNSHNPMMDTNSDEVAGLILDWLAARRAEGAFA